LNGALVMRAFAVANALALVGCTSIGPATVARDRFDYNGEVARSWKEQILLNIVKCRYLDVPVFLDISQIVSGYTVQSGLSLSGSTGDPLGNGVNLSAQGVFTDRPTITYTPLTGAQFNRNMLTPIPPSEILFTMTSGWPVDLVFRLTVRSINGIDAIGADAEKYNRLLALMRQLQLANAVGMRVVPGKSDASTVLIVFPAKPLTPELEAARHEIRDMLGLPADENDISVVFGQSSARRGEIAMQTLSIMQILINLGNYVAAPQKDIDEGRTRPGFQDTSNDPGRLRVNFSHDHPTDDLVSVAYRGGWFWIDDRDVQSKTTFALLMLLSTLTESGTRESLPLVTIPAG
jgi:hypothetical protein